MVIPADGLFALPPHADPRQLAMLTINPPTAALLLSEYVNLKPGEWVVQNSDVDQPAGPHLQAGHRTRLLHGLPGACVKLAPAAAQAAEMVASGRMHIRVAATYPLSSIKEGVAHAQRGGKVLLDLAGSST